MVGDGGVTAGPPAALGMTVIVVERDLIRELALIVEFGRCTGVGPGSEGLGGRLGVGLGGVENGVRGGEVFRELFEAFGFAGDVVTGEIAVEAGDDGAERAGVLNGEAEAGDIPVRFDLMAADDFYAEVVSGPGEGAPAAIE